MAIAFDATSTGNGSGTSITVAHTCTGDNRILWVGVRTFDGSTPASDPVSGITYNGVAMTLAGTRNNPATDQVSYLYYLIAPATGANNIVVSCSSVDEIAVRATSYTGALQSGVPDAYATGADTTSPLTITVTTILDNCWLVGLFDGDSGNGITASTNATNRNTNGNSDLIVDTNGAQTPAGSHSMTCTTTSFKLYGIVASFAPVAALGPANLKSYNTNLKANIKSVNTNILANIKSINTIT